MQIKPAISFSSLVLFSLFITITFNSCFKDLTKLQVVYYNNFEDYKLDSIEVSGWLNGGFGPVDNIKIVDYNGNKVLGRFNNNNIQLKLNNLPDHTAISIEFDLYLHDNWENSTWLLTFDGYNQLVTGFSNNPNIQQSYPNWKGNGSALSPAGANAFTMNLPGACSLINSTNGTSMYKMVKTVLHNKDSFQLNCSDAVIPFNDLCKISWSIDNLKITIIKN